MVPPPVLPPRSIWAPNMADPDGATSASLVRVDAREIVPLASREKRMGRLNSMRQFFQLVVLLTVLAAALAGPARAQDSAVHIVTYVELMPDEIAGGAALLKHDRDVSRRKPGNLRFDVLHEIARPNRFAILEAWKDKADRDAHSQATATAQFRARLKAIEDAPDDERVIDPVYV